MAFVTTHLVKHPLVGERLASMRSVGTDNATFRAALHEMATMLVYEALRDAPSETFPVTTPIQETLGVRLSNPPLLVPVLRAGLGMASAVQNLLPNAQMGFVGLARDEQTHEPRAYMESLPATLRNRPVLVLDPMLATGGSLVHCVRLLLDRGATDITVLCVLAAPSGLERLEECGVPLDVYTASVDERLNEHAFIVPGLGDAGDRQFGAV